MQLCAITSVLQACIHNPTHPRCVGSAGQALQGPVLLYYWYPHGVLQHPRAHQLQIVFRFHDPGRGLHLEEDANGDLKHTIAFPALHGERTLWHVWPHCGCIYWQLNWIWHNVGGVLAHTVAVLQRITEAGLVVNITKVTISQPQT